jgi:transaldolase|tara:strand:- start:612 stop:1313 length:702 start_codon:yes stop_codon:yes gene_type:complete
MKIKVYADGASLTDMLEAYNGEQVSGFTTNPTLMKKAGVVDYLKFAKSALENIQDMPISFEVFSDDFDEMYEQAKKLAALGENVFVKIPVTNTSGEFAGDLINRLDKENVKMNITAVFTKQQVQSILENINTDNPHIISIFAGRIADTGLDPVTIMKENLEMIKNKSENLQLLWASPREVLNVYQADEIGCDIITITTPLLNKLKLKDKDLSEYSLETVKMFYDDAQKVGYEL